MSDAAVKESTFVRLIRRPELTSLLGAVIIFTFFIIFSIVWMNTTIKC